MTKRGKVTYSRSRKGRFAWKNGGLKLALSLLAAFFIALAVAKGGNYVLDNYTIEVFGKEFGTKGVQSPVPLDYPFGQPFGRVTPSERKATYEAIVYRYLEKKGSPMATLAGAFYKAERKHGFPKYLLVAVLAVESGYGKHYIKETNNPLGWGRGKVGFASIEEAINTVAYKVSMAPETEYLYRGFRATREVAQFCLEYNAPEAKEYCYKLMQVINELKATEWEL